MIAVIVAVLLGFLFARYYPVTEAPMDEQVIQEELEDIVILDDINDDDIEDVEKDIPEPVE